MGRGKLSMELITNKKTRNTTYQNRKHGIIKKANELSVLCDVNTLIIFCPPDSNHPDIWSQNPDQINNTIRSYKQEKNKNGKRLTYDLKDYYQSRKRKIEDQLIRAREKNMEAKYPTWFDDLNGLSEGQLRQFAMGLERKKLIVAAHLQLKKRNSNVPMPFGFEIGNNQLANGYQNLGQVQALVSHDDVGWFDVASNQPANHYMGLNPSLDQVQDFNHAVEWFDDDALNQPANHYMGSNPSLDQVQDFNHAVEWFDDEPTTSSVQLEPETGIGFDYPVSEGEVVYDGSKPCVYQPVQQCCPMPEESALEESDVNDDDDGIGIEDFVIDDDLEMVVDYDGIVDFVIDDDLGMFKGYDGIGDFVIDDDLGLFMG